MRALKSLYLLIIALILTIIFFPIAFIFSMFRNIHRISDYFFNVAIGLDQLGGSVLYSQPDWTISSYTYILSKSSKKYYYFMKFIDFFFGKNHCKKSYENETKIFRELYNTIYDGGK